MIFWFRAAARMRVCPPGIPNYYVARRCLSRERLTGTPYPVSECVSRPRAHRHGAEPEVECLLVWGTPKASCDVLDLGPEVRRRGAEWANITAAVRLGITHKVVSAGHYYPQISMEDGLIVPHGMIPCLRKLSSLPSVGHGSF